MLFGILSDDIEHHWSALWPVLERAVEKGNGEYTAESLLIGIRNRDLQMWTDIDEEGVTRHAMVTTLEEFSDGKLVCKVLYIAGDDVDTWLGSTIDELESWAMDHGCSEMWGTGRKGWERKLEHFGFRYGYTTVIKELGVKQ